MNEDRYIHSNSNSKIKHFLQLKEKSKARLKAGECTIEGRKEIEMALEGGYELVQVFYDAASIDVEFLEQLKSIPSLEVFEVSHELYNKLAHRGSTEGVVAIAKTKSHDLSALHLPDSEALLLIAEAPEKPGNIGALLRTADAAAIDAVIIANPRGDLYNPNSIRSSLGCIFTVPTYLGSSEEVIQFLKSENFDSYSAALEASVPYTEVEFSGRTAIVVGTEATGLSDVWLKNSTQNIIIPMRGQIDSMNVSVAAAVILFEAVRQISQKR